MKKVNVTRSYLPDLNVYMKYLEDLWETRLLTNNGKYHQLLEERLGVYLESPNLSLFTNGHLALEYALDSLQKRGEIITTPFTFASSTQAIFRTGNTPVFCDIRKSDYTIDPLKIEELITDKTIAILPVHVYGNICDVEKIEEIAKKHNLKVIYDAAHVFGVKYKNKGIGSFGDISMFSLHATKVFHTIEGGILTYNNSDLKSIIDSLKNFGITSPEAVSFVGGNGKLDEFRAAMGLCNLDIVDNHILMRKSVVERYIRNLKDIPGIILNYLQKDVMPNYAYFPVLFENYKYTRDEINDLLSKNNIFSRKYFYPLTSNFDAYRGLIDIQKTPIANQVANNILTLPLYSELSFDEVDRICNIIKEGVL